MSEPQTITIESVVNDWLYRDGVYPGDSVVAARVKEMIDDWVLQRDRGLDIVASRALADMQELSVAIEGV